MKKSWYYSNKSVFFIFLILSIIFLLSAVGIKTGVSTNLKYLIYTIEFEWFGMDSSKIEEVITIPLENKLMTMEGLLTFSSSAEYGKSYTTVYFSKEKNHKNVFLTIRNIVDTLYSELPDDVQKPRIYSNETGTKSCMCISFEDSTEDSNLREWIENTIKKSFESIDGVSEVIVSGGAQKEISVEFNTEKAASAQQNPSDFASIIQDANTVSPGSQFENSRKIDTLIFDTKLKSINQIKSLPIRNGESITNLEYMADIEKKTRTQEESVLVDGKPAVSVSIKASSSGNSIYISHECKKILNSLDQEDIKYTLLYDKGREQLKLINKVLFSLIQSIICIFIIIILFYNSKKSIYLILCFLIFNCLWTLGILSLLNISLNQNSIAGLSIALGLIADPVLVISECEEKSYTRLQFINRFKDLIPSLISAGLTTLLCLIPLFFLEPIVPGSKTIAITICIMLIVSIILSVFFYPVFDYSEKNNTMPIKRITKKLERFCSRFSFRASFLTSRHTLICKAFFMSLILLTPFIFYISGKNLTLTPETDIIYCSAEYDSETNISYINKELMPVIEQLKSKSFIRFIRTETRKGSSEIEIGYDPQYDHTSVAEYINSLGKKLSDGFLFVPSGNSSSKKRKSIQKIESIQICIKGDESNKCREYAEKMAQTINESKIADSVVLNFKKNNEEIHFIPDRDKLIKNGITIQQLSSNLRWYLFGAVADKWLQDGKEYDIRISGKNLKKSSLEQIQNLFIPCQTSSVRLASLGKIIRTTDSGKVYRQDGKRCAYFTVEISGYTTDNACMILESTLNKISMERGYSFSFSREYRLLSKNYRTIFIILIITITAMMILITGLTENWKSAAKIISVVPASLSIPMIIIFFTSGAFELGDIVGMIVLSGITVNNAIYITESKKQNYSFKLREKIKSILVTSLTTVAGAVPLYLLSADSFSKSLSFFMIWGIISSVIIVLSSPQSLPLTPEHPAPRNAGSCAEG